MGDRLGRLLQPAHVAAFIVKTHEAMNGERREGLVGGEEKIRPRTKMTAKAKILKRPFGRPGFVG